VNTHTPSGSPVSADVGADSHVTASSAHVPPTDGANLPGSMSSDSPGAFLGEKLRVLDLFSGIGGFSLGLDRARTPCGNAGFETVAFCEIEPFPRKVLAKHWPEVPQYHDVTKLTGDILRRDGISVDVITGGFPCQDISCAGKQAGISEGTRSGLWSEIVRLIGELSPRFVIVENVAALLSGPSEQRGGWFGSILGDLAECGYDAEWENIPAAAVGAPHRRERVWIVAYPRISDGAGSKADAEYSNGDSQRPHRAGKHINGSAEQGHKQERFSGSIGEVLADTACDRRAVSGTGDNRRGIAETDGGRLRPQSSGASANSSTKSLADANSIGKLSADRGRTGRKAINDTGGELSGNGSPYNVADAERIGQPGPGKQILAGHCAQNIKRQASDALNERGRPLWCLEPDVGRVANGVPQRVDRLKGLGNAVVPQIPELIGNAILAAEATQ
jgi:DNA (cytosine-5)-methyltransferase 1